MSMKVSYLIIFLVLSQSYVIGQITVSNLSLTQPDSNLVYGGVPNKIKITGLKNIAKAYLSVNGLYAFPSEDSSFNIYPTVLDTSRIDIYELDKFVTSKKYYTVIIPEGRGYLGIYRDTTLKIKYLKKNNLINMQYPGSIYIHNFNVTRFDAVISSNSDPLYSEKNINGNILPEKFTKKLKRGDRLIISNIIVMNDEKYPLKEFYIDIK